MLKILTVLLILSVFSMSTFAQNEIELIEFSTSECKNEGNLRLIQKRIVSQEISNDTLNIEVATWLNCGYSNFGRAKTTGDTLQLSSLQYESKFEITDRGDTVWIEMIAVECTCCFHFYYQIAGIESLPKYVTLNDELIQLSENEFLPPTYKVVNGDSLIQSDAEGFSYNYIYYDSGKVETVWKKKLNYSFSSTYYESGELKRTFESFGTYNDYIETTYDKQGNVIENQNTTDKQD
jgi:hypothetical protein